jgi:hypothetical protein
MPAKIKQIAHSRMNTKEAACLTDRLKLAHTPFSRPGRLMRLLYSIVLILPSTVPMAMLSIARMAESSSVLWLA